MKFLAALLMFASLQAQATCVDHDSDDNSPCVEQNLDCGGVSHGATLIGWVSPVSPCIPAVATCIDGEFDAPIPHPFCKELQM
jgi:hypothetical protein